MPTARFVAAFDAVLPDVHVGPEGPAPKRCVLVETDAGQPLLRIDVYASRDAEVFAFEDARVWQRWVVIGLGHFVHLVGLEGQASRSLALGGYFAQLHPGEDFLLVASGEQLFRTEPDGSTRWRSAALGVDGVVVDRVDADVIEGQGEWDPPGGWRPFTLSVATGQAV